MKKLIRTFLANSAAIYLISRFIGGLSFSNDWRVLLMAAAALTLANFLIRPIVKIVTLPINLLTLGFFSSFINALMLYLVTYLVPKFTIQGFEFVGFTHRGLIVPSLHFGAFWATVIFAALISWVVSLIDWITD